MKNSSSFSSSPRPGVSSFKTCSATAILCPSLIVSAATRRRWKPLSRCRLGRTFSEAEQRTYSCPTSTQMTWINPMPMFHTAGCGLVTLGALQTGGTQVLPPGFDPELVLRLFEEERGTVMLCVPTMLIRMLEHPSIGDRDFSSWRLVTLGGAPVPPELVRRTQSMGIKVAIGFGQTEASPYITHTLPDDPHPDWMATVGRPLPGTEVKVVDPLTDE